MTSVWRLGHDRGILNHAPPTVSVHFWMKRLLYYIQSVRSRKNKPCPLFSSFNILFLLEVRHNTEVKTVANFRFTRTLKSAWNGSCDRPFFSTVTYIQVKRLLKWEGGTWFHPSGIDWIVGSWGVTNKIEADLKCQFAVSGGGFLATGFTADTQAWINVLFIRDDDHDQWHKTCLNSTRERESAWMTERVLHQVKSNSWNKIMCDVLRVMLL